MAIDPKTGLPIPDGFAGSKRERLANQYDYGTKTNEVADFAGSKKEREANKAKWNAKFGYPEGSPQNPRTAPKTPPLEQKQIKPMASSPALETPKNYVANLKAEEEKRSGTVSATAGKETVTLGPVEPTPTTPTTPATPTAPVAPTPTTPATPTPTTPAAPVPATPAAPSPTAPTATGAPATPTAPTAPTTPATPTAPTAGKPSFETYPTDTGGFAFDSKAVAGLKNAGFSDEEISNMSNELGRLKYEKEKKRKATYDQWVQSYSTMEKNKGYYSNWDDVSSRYNSVTNDVRNTLEQYKTNELTDEQAQAIAKKYGISIDQVKRPETLFDGLQLTDEWSRVFGKTKFDQNIADLTTKHERDKADLTTNLSIVERKTNDQLDDVGRQMEQNLNWMQASGIWSGAARSSGYQAGINNLRSDANRTVTRIMQSLQDSKASTAKDLLRINEDFDNTVTRAKTEFDQQLKDLKYNQGLALTALTEKFGAGSKDLTYALDDITNEFAGKSVDVFTKYVQAKKAAIDITNSQLDQVQKLQDAIDKLSDKRYTEVTTNKELLASYSTEALMNDVNSGRMTVERANDIRNVMVSTVANTLSGIGKVGANEMSRIESLIDTGYTPIQAITIMKNDPAFSSKQVAKVSDIGDGLKRVEYSDGSVQDFQDGVPVIRSITWANVDVRNVAGLGVDTEWTAVSDYSTKKRGKTNLQCGELVNDYWTMMTGERAGMGNTLDSKLKAIYNVGRSESPVAGGLFVSNPLKNNVGHTGIVQSVNADGSITVLEANSSGSDNGEPPKIKTYSKEEWQNMAFSVPPQKTAAGGALPDLTSERTRDDKGRLRFTGNVAADLNNPGNLTAGGSADRYAVGYVTVKWNDGNVRKFLVFPSAEAGYQAVEADLEAKIAGKSSYVTPNDTLGKLLEVWAGKASATPNYKSVVAKNSGYSLDSPISGMDAGKILAGIKIAEGFKGEGQDYSFLKPKTGEVPETAGEWDPNLETAYKAYLGDGKTIPKGVNARKFMQQAEAYRKSIESKPKTQREYTAEQIDVLAGASDMPEKAQAGALSQAGLTLEDLAKYKEGAISVPSSSQAKKLQETADLVQEIINHPARERGTGYTAMLPTLTASGKEFKALFDKLVSFATLANTGQLKGVLSETDMKIIKEASSPAILEGSEENFLEKMTEMYRKISEKINIRKNLENYEKRVPSNVSGNTDTANPNPETPAKDSAGNEYSK